MTKEEKLLYAIGEIDDELILAAEGTAPSNITPLPASKRWKKTALTAACLLICAGVWFSVGDLFRMGSSMKATEAPAASAPSTTTTTATTESVVAEEETVEESVVLEEELEEAPAEAPAANQKSEDSKLIDSESGGPVKCPVGEDEDFYINYNLPLMTLDLEGDSEGISAERKLTLDANGIYRTESGTVSVTDRYLLTNSSPETKTITLSYHYGNDLRNMDEVSMTVDGSSEGQSMTVNNAYNRFTEEGMNVENSSSWDTMVDAFDEEIRSVDENVPSYGDEIITVYELYDPVVPADIPDAASIAVHFNCPEDTFIWNNNFNGMWQDGEERFYDVFVSEFSRHPLQSRSLWVFGETEPLEITVKGYTDGGCETELPGLTAKVRRYTTTLREAISQSVWQYVDSNHIDLSSVGEETLTNAVLQYLEYSPLGSEPKMRYDMLMSWELYSDVLAVDRSFTLEQEVTIPANDSVEVLVQLEKQPNQVFMSQRICLDAATTLASELNVENSTIKLIPPEGGTIIGGNLGEGETVIDPDVERWYVVCEEGELCSLPLAP